VELPVDKGRRNRTGSIYPEASIAVNVAGHGMNKNEMWNPKGAGGNGAHVKDGGESA